MRAGHPQLRPLHQLRDPLPQPRGGPGLTLVAGIGNRYRGDDAAGLDVIARLRAAGVPDHVRLIEQEGEPAGLIDEWESGDVIVVDAVRSGAEPGTVHRLDALAGPLPARLVHVSSHAFGLVETVELARALGRLPSSLELIAIEGRDFSAGASPAPEVQAAVARVTAELAERLADGPSG